MKKSPEAFRTISEVADWLDTPPHVLRFWESRFPEVAPIKRAGGRRYYRPEDMQLLGGIKFLLHVEGHTIRAVQDRLRADGAAAVAAFSQPLDGADAATVETPELATADAAEALDWAEPAQAAPQPAETGFILTEEALPERAEPAAAVPADLAPAPSDLGTAPAAPPEEAVPADTVPDATDLFSHTADADPKIAADDASAPAPAEDEPSLQDAPVAAGALDQHAEDDAASLAKTPEADAADPMLAAVDADEPPSAAEDLAPLVDTPDGDLLIETPSAVDDPAEPPLAGEAPTDQSDPVEPTLEVLDDNPEPAAPEVDEASDATSDVPAIAFATARSSGVPETLEEPAAVEEDTLLSAPEVDAPGPADLDLTAEADEALAATAAEDTTDPAAPAAEPQEGPPSQEGDADPEDAPSAPAPITFRRSRAGRTLPGSAAVTAPGAAPDAGASGVEAVAAMAQAQAADAGDPARRDLPIGFFFDDSADAAPATAQSGRLADPDPEPEQAPDPELEPGSKPSVHDPGQAESTAELAEFADDAPWPDRAVPHMAARIRALDPAFVPLATRTQLRGLHDRLAEVRNG